MNMTTGSNSATRNKVYRSNIYLLKKPIVAKKIKDSIYRNLAINKFQ